MNRFDVIVGSFPTSAWAKAAAAEIASSLELDRDLVSTERVRVPGDARGLRRVVLVAWVPISGRRQARDIIERHRGRQAPLDWLSGRQERVAPETFPVPGEAA